MKAMWTYIDRSRSKLLWTAACALAGLGLLFSRTVVTCVQSTATGSAPSVAHATPLQLALVSGCGAIAAVVVCVLLHSVATFPDREQPGKRRFRATGEFLWALVPVVILFGMAAPAVGALVSGDTPVASQETVNTGYRCTLVGETPF